MVRNNFMMHICTVATLCFPEKTVPRNYYYCVQDDNSLSLCFKSMYRTLFVAIFTSTFIFSMFKSFHTYRNINISNQYVPSAVFYHPSERSHHDCIMCLASPNISFCLRTKYLLKDKQYLPSSVYSQFFIDI